MGNGANAAGRYFPHDKEICTNCGKKVLKSDTPMYFELNRVLCGPCHVRRGANISRITKSAHTDGSLKNAGAGEEVGET